MLQEVFFEVLQLLFGDCLLSCAGNRIRNDERLDSFVVKSSEYAKDHINMRLPLLLRFPGEIVCCVDEFVAGLHPIRRLHESVKFGRDAVPQLFCIFVDFFFGLQNGLICVHWNNWLQVATFIGPGGDCVGGEVENRVMVSR